MRALHSSGKQIVVLATACAATAGVWGCSLLLDTDKLQKGSGAAGAAGVPNDASLTDQDSSIETGPKETGPDDTSPTETSPADVAPDAPPSCKTDTDCFEVSAKDECKLYECDTVKELCKEPAAYSGPVVRAVDAAPIVVTWDRKEIGLPTLLAMGEDVYLGAWFDDGATKDVILNKYAEIGTLTPSSFSSLFGNYFKVVVSSPGMMVEQVGSPSVDRIAVLIGTAPNTTTEPCVYRFWVASDLSTGDAPSINCLGPYGYDADPTRSAPMFVNRAPNAATLWAQAGELYVDNVAVTTDGGVKSFSPLLGPAPGIGAVLQTGATPAEEDTAIWYKNKGMVTGLNGVPKGPRLGTSSTVSAEDDAGVANLVSWAHPKAGAVDPLSTIELFQYACSSLSCQNSAFPQGGLEPGASVSLLAPVLASRTLPTGSALFSGVVLASSKAASTEAVLAGSVAHLPSGKKLNPQFLDIGYTSVTGSRALSQLPSVLGQTAAVLTDKGRLFVAWVQRDDANKASLLLRRYKIAADCKAP